MITVFDDYYIDVTEMEYMACQYNGKKYIDKRTGKEKNGFRVIGHYSTLKSAVKGILNHSVKVEFMSDRTVTLSEAVKRLEAANNRLESILDEVE